MKYLEAILVAIFGTHSAIATTIVSMCPIIELKGAIPLGMSTELWGIHALSGRQAFWFSLLGSSLVVPILALIFTPVLKWLKSTKIFKRAAFVIEQKVSKHSTHIQNKTNTTKKPNILLRCFCLFIFVSVPLPLTGVWTGTCVGVMLGLKFWQILLSVISGNVLAGLIIYFILARFPQLVTVLLIAVLAIAVVVVAYLLIKLALSKNHTSTVEQ